MKQVFTGIALLAGLTACTASFAGDSKIAAYAEPTENRGLYVGGTLAFPATFSDRHFETIPAILFPANADSNGYKLGGGGFIGYMFDSHWMLELGANFFGDNNYTLANAVTGAPAGTASVTDQYQVSLSALYNFPVTSYLDFYPRLGSSYFHKRYTVNATGFPALVSQYSTLAFLYGVGLNLKFHDKAGVRIEYSGQEAADHLDFFHFVPNYGSIQLYYKFFG
ncbi:outer membrane beta-barrel protein [Legionella spiritensis]|uniref:outer membrane beta-barrel protein n=1 Tax=Legionella spiritensis TaxID=452 RepID=UPI000F6D8CDD|nr:outer membrane beta-barrel protein [Legionella spiritensis]VEG92262.1 outer membrane protein A [Legionella spiritensis]